ncbi:MAG: hypothetical protein GF384_01725 [Elusimicrobia bacterium]|nr:hypothetical protein [Elusimicrobiota bacterium]MBD3411716.1 hypothetical protein [Elusimicrobiota bacterium]
MTITLGHIGLGYWGPNLLRVFMGIDECTVAAVCDLNTAQLNNVRAHNSDIQTTKNYKDLISNTSLDAVVIATPTRDHYQIAIDALKAHKHIFVEKPLAMTTDQCRELIEQAEKNKKVLMVGHLLKYHPAVHKVKDYLENGEIGKIRYLYTTRVNLGKIRDVENVMWSLAPHDISTILYFLDTNKPTGISVVGESYLQNNICDVAFLTLFFESNIFATMHVSWLDPHKIRKMTLVGDKKMIVLDDMQPNEKVRLYDAGVDFKFNYTDFQHYLSLRHGDVIIPKIDMKEPLVNECRHFCECINHNKQPVSDGADGLRVVQILEAADRSLHQKGSYIPIS